MSFISDIRSQYPQYQNLTDKQIADGFHAKYYSDIPINDYYEKIGFEDREKTLFGIGEEGLGGFGEVVKGIPRGLGVTTISGLEGLAQIFDPNNDSAVVEALGGAKEYINELDFLKPKEGYEDALSTKFGQGLGSLASFVGAGAFGPAIRGTYALTKYAKGVTYPLAGLAIGSGVSQQADNIERTRAEGKDISFGQEIFSELGGGVVGATEIFVPRLLGQMLEGVPKGQSGKIVNFFRRTETKKINGQEVEVPAQRMRDYFIGGVKTGGLEGTQELVASVAQNLISRGVYNADIPISESALDELTVGGMVGFASDSIMRAVSRKGLVTKYNEEQAKEADKRLNSQNEQIKKNVKLASEQGDRVMSPSEVREPALLPVYEFENYRLQGNISNNLNVEESNIDELINIRESLLRSINSKKLDKEELSKQEKDLYAINQQIEKTGEANSRLINPEPLIQNFNLQTNPLDGTITVFGETDGINYGTFQNIEEATKAQAELFDLNSDRYLINKSEQAASINGLLGNGTAEYIGRYVYDPFQHSISSKAIANADEKIGIDRQKQAKVEEEILRQEAEVLGTTEGQQVSVNELYMRDDDPGKTTTELIEEETKSEERKKLANINIVPLDTSKVDRTSQLGMLYEKAEKLGLERKAEYSIQEAKQLLNKKDFDALITSLHETRIKINRNTRIKSAVKRQKEIIEARAQRRISENKREKKQSLKEDTNALQEVLNKKNIQVDFNSPEFKFFANVLVGEQSLNKMSKGQRQLLIAKIASLPRFDTQTKLPDYSDKPYSAQQINSFYQHFQNTVITNKQIKTFIKNNRTNKDLTNQEIKQFKNDLINSGRAIKQKNGQLKLVDDFISIQESKMTRFVNETNDSYRLRLQTQTSRTNEDIEKRVIETENQLDLFDESIEDTETSIPQVPAEKYETLLNTLRQRLDDIGLSDVGLKLDNKLRNSLNVRKVGSQAVYKPVDKDVRGVYDAPLNRIVLATSRFDPNNELTTAEFEAKVKGTMDHEIIHALVQTGLLKESEFQQLLKDGRRELSKIGELKRIENAYDNEVQSRIDEEIVAEFFRMSLNESQRFAPKSKTIIQKIINIFRSFSRAIFNSFGRSSQDIIDDIENGNIGSRRRNQSLNMQSYRFLKEKELKTKQDKIEDFERRASFSRNIDGDIRDLSSGMAADRVPLTRGPRASNLLEDVEGDGFSPNDIYTSSRYYIASNPNGDFEQKAIHRETMAFMQELKRIKGDPNAIITMYRAAPTKELRDGDLITPSKTEAQFHVNQSTITNEQIRKADRERLRQKQVDETGAINLQQEKLYNQMDEMFDLLGGPQQTTPSKLFEYKLKAGDVRWDGNQLERWGYFPSNVVGINENINVPSYSREDITNPNQERIYSLTQVIEGIKGQLRHDTMMPNTRIKLQNKLHRLQSERDGLMNEPSYSREPKTTEEELAQAQREAFKRTEETAKGNIPRINKNASPLAIKTALEIEEGTFNRPTYNIEEKVLPKKYEELGNRIDKTGTKPPVDKTEGERLLDIVEFKEEGSTFLKRMYKNMVDSLYDQERGTNLVEDISVNPTKYGLDESEAKPEVKILLNQAKTGAIQALRMVGQARSLFSQILVYGVPKVIDESGNVVSKSSRLYGGTKIVGFKHGGLIKIFAPLFTGGTNLESLFKYYAISKRGKRLNEEGKEVPITQSDIELGLEIVKEFPEIATVYEQYQEFNNEIIDYAVQMGILSENINKKQLIDNILKGEFDNGVSKVKWSLKGLDENSLNKLSRDELFAIAQSLGADTRGTAQIWKDNSDYYPFYRQMTDETIRGPNIASGFMSGNPLNIKLKGSEEAIEPAPLEAISRNILSILTASMKNEGMARLMNFYAGAKLAEVVNRNQVRNHGDLVTIFEDGEQVTYRVADPILIDGLQTLGVYNPAGFMEILGMPSSVLRELVTRDPAFMMRNMMRDTISAWATSGVDFTPFIDTFKNFTTDLSELERAGIIGGYDASLDQQGLKKQLQKEIEKQGMLDKDGSIKPLSVVGKIWDGLGRATVRSDGATRKGVYDKILEETNDQVEAIYQGLEIINFNRRGASPYMKIVTTAIPFLNARIQGLDVLGRAMTGKYSGNIAQLTKSQQNELANKIRIRFMARIGMLTFLTGVYYALVADTEEYKALPQQARDDNFIVPLGKNLPPFRLPIAFEIGFLSKVVPERFLDLAFGESNLDDTINSLKRGVTQTLKVDPLGFQIIKPIREAYNNKNSFTGNAIVPYWMEEGLQEQLQLTRNTSEFARMIGEATNISPLKIDYVMKGYTGSIGAYVLQISDMLTRQVTDRHFITPRLEDLPFFKSFLLSRTGGGLQEQFYNLRKESNKFQATVNKLKEEGRGDELQLYFKNNLGLQKTRKEILRIDRYLAKFRENIKNIENSDMSPSEKRERINQLEIERNIRLLNVPELKEISDIPDMFTDLVRN